MENIDNILLEAEQALIKGRLNQAIGSMLRSINVIKTTVEAISTSLATTVPVAATTAFTSIATGLIEAIEIANAEQPEAEETEKTAEKTVRRKKKTEK